MNNTRNQLKEFFRNEESLRRRLMLLMIPALVIMGVVAFVVSLIMGLGTVPVIQAALSFAVPLILMICGYRLKQFDVCYAVMCLFMCGLLYPSAILTTGGNDSGMIILCAGSLLMCGLCSTRTMRIIAGVLAVLAGTLAYCISIVRPDWVMQISQEKIVTFRFICYVFTGIAMFASGAMFIHVFDLNTRILKVLRRHMDDNISNEIITGDFAGDNGRRYNTVVMFADICNFTSLSESMETETVTEFLNTYFQIAYDAVSKNGGIIDKYMGDCVMAFWRDGDGSGAAAVKACRAAVEIKQKLKEQCYEINSRFKCEMAFSAGINYGISFVGDVGSRERKDFTAIGDTVNVASHIQEIAPKGYIYLSESMATLVADKAYIVKVPKKVAVRGKSDPMDIYTLISMETPADPTIVVNNHNPIGYTLHICGSRGSFSSADPRYEEFGGETSCYLLKKDNYALIVDCGSGLYRARPLLADCTDIDIILTHLHYDHIIGILDFTIFPKNAKLRFYGNFEAWLGGESLGRLFESPFWPTNLFRGEMINVNTQQDYQINSEIRVHFYPASHPDNANLAVIDVKGKRVCVMADTENPDDLPFDVVDHCDILIFDGMYEDTFYHEHVGWGHSTWQDGVRLAMRANPKRLIISHHSPRNSDEKLKGLEMRAQKDYPATTFAKAGDRFVL